MLQNTEKQSSLLNALIQFGLDPKEWSINKPQKSPSALRLLVNKMDPQFRLIGRADHKGWKNIQVFSL